ncbi:MAG: hypothetical protein JSW08_02545 [archaeon]|nr:MAG: hypothetical protein JSW08_02545 [archaeon]
MKIQIIAFAGQGTKLMTSLLGKILAQNHIHVYNYTLYGPTMRKGVVSSFLMTDINEIEVPFFEKSDLLLEFVKTEDALPTAKRIDGNYFLKITKEKLGHANMVNFVLLGFLLKQMKVKLNLNKWREYIPKNISKDWEKALEAGYNCK